MILPSSHSSGVEAVQNREPSQALGKALRKIGAAMPMRTVMLTVRLPEIHTGIYFLVLFIKEGNINDQSNN